MIHSRKIVHTKDTVQKPGVIKMESIWRKQTEIEESHINEKIKKSQHRDVIVIGAGMAGLLIAYFLKEQGKHVLVLEADRVASGQTERTTAKITSQHAVKYGTLIQKTGVRKAKLYAQANEAAIGEYEQLIRRMNIDCQFERLPAYLYSRKDADTLRREADAAIALGMDAEFTTETELPFSVAGAVCFRNQAQFHPLKFVRKISEGLEIWEHTRVIRISRNRVFTEDMVVTADKIVLAGHYPFINIPGFFFLREHQERSYVLALSGCQKLHGMYYEIDGAGLSFRMAGDDLLLGGENHRTGKNTAGGNYDRLVQEAKKYYPDCTETARWSAQDCMPHDGIPFIGKFSLFSRYLYVVTGFQKWGMTSSMVAAMILRDELCGRKSPYAEVFRPQRCHIRAGIRNLLVDVGESIKGIGKGLFHMPHTQADDLHPGHGGIVKYGGKRYACYRDDAGRLHKISARCPHMGCELTWNPDERSWDCPCHGSRFDPDGHLLDGPAESCIHRS